MEVTKDNTETESKACASHCATWPLTALIMLPEVLFQWPLSHLSCGELTKSNPRYVFAKDQLDLIENKRNISNEYAADRLGRYSALPKLTCNINSLSLSFLINSRARRA